MVVGAFPAAKLMGLILKQVSKPIANVAKEKAKNNYLFRTYVCMPPAQFYHWCEVKMKMWVMNLGRPVEIPKLNETMAIELGANLLGEGIIFVIAAGILTAEYIRSSVKESNKETARLEAMQDMRDLIRDLELEIQRQDAQIRELSRLCLAVIPATRQSPQSVATITPVDPEKPRGSVNHTTKLGTQMQSSTRYTDSFLQRAIDYSLEAIKR